MFTGVNLLVDGEFIGSMESLLANVALKRFFPRMDQFVTRDFVTASESTAALVTLVRLLDL